MSVKALLAVMSVSSLFGGAACFAEKQPLSLEAIFATPDLQNRTVENLQWSGSGFTFTEQNPDSGLLDIYEQNAASAANRLVVAGDALAFDGNPVRMSRYRWTNDRRFLLITGPETVTWDNVVEAPHYLYEIATGELRPLADDRTALRNVQLSPDGRHVGYVFDNDIYVAEVAGGSSRAVTSDGSADIFNGIFDYGSSEFGSVDAWHWSPDGSKIAFWRLDVTDVKVFYMIDELGAYNEVRALKYPNTGEKHAVNRIGVFDLESGGTTWMDIGNNVDDYIPRINWAGSSQTLAIQRLSRDHKTLDLLLGDTNSGETRVIVTDTDPAWVDTTDDLMFLGNQERFVWTSEKSGYRHAYLYDFRGDEVPLTRGDWEITSLAAVDEGEGWLYFYAKKGSFIDQHVYRVRLDGSDLQKVSGPPGWYEWNFSPDRTHVLETFSSARTPPVVTLRKASGKAVRILEASTAEALAKYAVPNPGFVKIETSDGIVLNASMIKPSDFDPGKKYPVIGYGYGNAGSQVVMNRWGNWRGAEWDLWHRYMAEQGFIIFSLDNRTTAGRGKKAKNLTYGHYAKYAVHDQLEALEYLKSLPYVDASRLGFWGWSGGGYLACALMTKGAPHFKTAVSVAPVIDLSRYQAVGVERWMGMPDENPQGYREVNLLNYADKLEGDLLLIHGSGDENVKFAFTLQFANALIEHNKQFDMLVYPNRHHGIDDAQLHVFTRITNYFLDKL